MAKAETVTTEEAAKFLNISPRQLYRVRDELNLTWNTGGSGNRYTMGSLKRAQKKI